MKSGLCPESMIPISLCYYDNVYGKNGKTYFFCIGFSRSIGIFHSGNVAKHLCERRFGQQLYLERYEKRWNQSATKFRIQL